jgi:hypothetical protein
MYDTLFDRQSVLTDRRLDEFATELGLACFGSHARSLRVLRRSGARGLAERCASPRQQNTNILINNDETCDLVSMLEAIEILAVSHRSDYDGLPPVAELGAPHGFA